MRKIYFLTPEMEIRSGGYTAELATAEIFRDICDVSFVTYRKRAPNVAHLDDILTGEPKQSSIFVIFWAHDIPELLYRLKGHCLLYHAHSSGYGFQLPSNIPILAVSRHTMAYWGRFSPNNPIFLLSNCLVNIVDEIPQDREFDILVQTRKSSTYLLETLLPMLQGSCKVCLLHDWVENLDSYFLRSKIYLYDSTEYWLSKGVSEGFGLPPLEALACGCTVFSSVNDALADYLEPEVNCQQLRCFSSEYDRRRILAALADWKQPANNNPTLAPFRKGQILPKARLILKQINQFFDLQPELSGDIPQPQPKILKNIP